MNFPRYFRLLAEPRESPLLYIRHDDEFTDPKCVARGMDEFEPAHSPWPLSSTISLVALGRAKEISAADAARMERGDRRMTH